VGRKIDVDHLVGAAEIAERLGVKRPHLIHDWRRRYPEFPEPVLTLKGTLIWDWKDIERWAKTTQRLSSAHLGDGG
jgi:predicted DNA-binding transcriptional regulator AlpA|tara:strand:- start:65 stop:292 length:228 start_codon:yes stop_codon:yes gene_type:complete